MAGPIAGTAAGIIAGAAGTTALKAVSYVDQALRGQASGDTPARTAAALVDAAGISTSGGSGSAANRHEGIGELAGMGVGVGVAVTAALLRTNRVKVPKPLSAITVGLAAMVVSNAVMVALDVSEPREWTVQSFAADALPHLAYGLMTTAALHRLLDPRTPHAG